MVFRSQQDRGVYLDHLRRHSVFAEVSILAYCLMPNHIHLTAVPRALDGLALMLRRVHGMYARYFNVRTSRSGHLWQNRFYSCPLSESHLWTAIRYVELNPVRAALVAAPDSTDGPAPMPTCREKTGTASSICHFFGAQAERLCGKKCCNSRTTKS